MNTNNKKNTMVVPTPFGPILGLTRRTGQWQQQSRPFPHIDDSAKIGTINVTSFWGIPYAQPPIKELRFHPPQPLQKPPLPQKNTQIEDAEAEDSSLFFLDASVPPEGTNLMSCLQPKSWNNYDDGNSTTISSIGTEDCLKLHIYTPTEQLLQRQQQQRQRHHHTEKKSGVENNNNNVELLLPVLVWIHGGAYEWGDGWEYGLYDGIDIVQETNIVVVSIQYRLGILGFLVDDQLVDNDENDDDIPNNKPKMGDGNYGLLDQQEALRWIQKYIKYFGGNAQQITIMGESAGGISICYHLVSPYSVGLFHNAIMQSGSCDISSTYATKKYRQSTWHKKIVPKTNCTNSTIMTGKEYTECIQQLSPEFIIQQQEEYDSLVGITVGNSDLYDFPLQLMKNRKLVATTDTTRYPSLVVQYPNVMFTEVGYPLAFHCSPGQDLRTCPFLSLVYPPKQQPTTTTATTPTLTATRQNAKKATASGPSPFELQLVRHLLQYGTASSSSDDDDDDDDHGRSTFRTNITDAIWSSILKRYPPHNATNVGLWMSTIWTDAMTQHKSLFFGQCSMLRSLQIYLETTPSTDNTVSPPHSLRPPPRGYAAVFEQLGQSTLVGHADDLSYTFFHPYRPYLPNWTTTKEDIVISTQLVHAIGNFVRSGNPGHDWPEYYHDDDETGKIALFRNTKIEYQPSPRREFCKFWQELQLPDRERDDFQSRSFTREENDVNDDDPNIISRFGFGEMVSSKETLPSFENDLESTTPRIIGSTRNVRPKKNNNGDDELYISTSSIVVGSGIALVIVSMIALLFVGSFHKGRTFRFGKHSSSKSVPPSQELRKTNLNHEKELPQPKPSTIESMETTPLLFGNH